MKLHFIKVYQLSVWCYRPKTETLHKPGLSGTKFEFEQTHPSNTSYILKMQVEVKGNYLNSIPNVREKPSPLKFIMTAS